MVKLIYEQFNLRYGYFHQIVSFIRFLLLLTLCAVNTFLPFILFQIYAFQNFCIDTETYAPEWCHNTVPFSYSSIQSKYWNVGFLRYFQVKQFPNFLLAAPILCLVFWSSFHYIRQTTIFQLWNIIRTNANILIFNPVDLNKKEKNAQSTGITNKLYIPFMVHSLFLSIFCLTCMHVQVANRFLLSSNPWPYWALFHLVNKQTLGPKTEIFVRSWVTIYFIVGTLMFANFLPFT